MTTPALGTPPADGVPPVSAPPAVDAAGNPVTPPKPDAVDAANKPKVYSEAEFKENAAKRDAAKAERDAAIAEVATLKAEKASREAATKQAEADAAAKRGEFERLYGDEKTAHLKTKSDLEAQIATTTKEWEAKVKAAEDKTADTVKQHKNNRARDAAENAFRHAGGTDLETFHLYAAPAIDKGEIAVDDKQQVTGVEALVSKLKEAKPFLFKPGAGGTPPGTVPAPGVAPPADPWKTPPGSSTSTIAAGWKAVRTVTPPK